MALKIETSNPATSHALPGKENVEALKASILPKETVGTAHPAPSGDSLNISINFPSAGKNISALLSSLIEMLKRPDVGAGLAPAQDGQPQGLPLLKNLFYKGEEPLSFLKNFIENSGLLYEAKIAKGDIQGAEDDLKGLLLRVIEKKGEQSETGKSARVLLNDIEARQLLNIKGKEEGVFYLQVPVSLPQGASTAEVYVRRDGKGKGGYKDDSYRIGFEIDLREAGLVSIDVLVGRKGRDATCYLSAMAENAEFLEFMRGCLPELSERLAGYGMRMVPPSP